jgi:serine O-acetyltransferase
VGELVIELADMLYDQVRWCLRYAAQIPGSNGCGEVCEDCDHKAAQVVAAFFERIPAIREMLAADVQAAFDCDPAAQSADETVFCYPGLFAIMVQRLAHELHLLNVPLLPRIMTEHAHSVTGIDIHPGARLGRSFLHRPRHRRGHRRNHGDRQECEDLSGRHSWGAGAGDRAGAPRLKRHPTIEDDVTIYAGATILGGDTVIGRGAIISGNVFITTSVPAQTIVSMEAPKLSYRQRRSRTKDAPAPEAAP